MIEPLILCGDAVEMLKALDDKSVHMCVTSPPYYGLRNYKTDGQIGLEKTPEQYVQRLVEVFREVRRVLRDDGTLWLNLGDSYASGKGSCFNPGGNENSIQDNIKRSGGIPTQRPNLSDVKTWGMKPKDLVGIPWMVAFALRADGWYLRSDIPWIKRNSMPSSVRDRPSSSIEHVFLFSKSKKYYYDYVGVMQLSSESYNKDKRPRGVIRQCVNPNSKYPNEGQFKKQDHAGNNTYTGFNERYESNGIGLRFMRDSDFFFRTWQGLLQNENGEPVAMIVNPRGYKGAHFACFPVQLVEPMILAGTSEKGVCPECGKPWMRVVESIPATSKPCPKTDAIYQAQGGVGSKTTGTIGMSGGGRTECIITSTGWTPSCSCKHIGMSPIPIPATVLDPFNGSGSSGIAAIRNGREYIGIDINPEYCMLAENRIAEEAYK